MIDDTAMASLLGCSRLLFLRLILGRVTVFVNEADRHIASYTHKLGTLQRARSGQSVPSVTHPLSCSL